MPMIAVATTRIGSKSGSETFASVSAIACAISRPVP
jgi:hypothetical protein